MNKLLKCSIILLLIALVFAQIFCINIFEKENNINECSVQNYKYNYKTITEITNELSCLKDKTILSAAETDGRWRVKVKLNGDKEELLEGLSKLKSYDINNYEIGKNDKEKYVTLEISSR